MNVSSDILNALSDLLTRHAHEVFCNSMDPASEAISDVNSSPQELPNAGGVIFPSEMLEGKKGKKCLIVTITDRITCSLITLDTAGKIYFDKLPLSIEIKPQIQSDENSIPFSFYKGREQKKWKSCHVDVCDEDIWTEQSSDLRINCSFSEVASSDDFQNAIVSTVRKAAKSHDPDVCVLCFSETDASESESSVSDFTRKFLKSFPDMEHAFIDDAGLDANNRILLWNAFNNLDQFPASQDKNFLTYDHNSKLATCYILRANQYEETESSGDLDGQNVCGVLHFNINDEEPLPEGHFQVHEDSHQRAMGHYSLFSGSLSAFLNEQSKSKLFDLEKKLELYVRTNTEIESETRVLDGLYTLVRELQVT
ncbi:TPA: hypothetical protein EYN23_01095 [Candidatus Poribacteria bacterium]|nr:hypothetical protein [Candidatus Poribacteria bacterium]